MKKAKSLLSIVLAVLMLFSLFIVAPITASAAGEIAGNGTNGISININASPYTDYAKKDYGKYAYTNKGCAWFASARVCQVTGKNTNILSGSSWYSTGYSTYGFSRGQSIKAKALACYSNHVAVVEIVNGNTVTVSEGGMPSYPNNGYCVIRTTTVSELQNRSACGSFLGYVYIGGGGSTPAPSGNNPIGYLDSVSSPSPGKIRVAGWALDLDQPTSSIAVHIYVGGPAGSAGAEGHPITANTLRSDVGSAYSKYGVGNYHGFDVTFSTSKTGSQSVYAYGINVGNGSSNTHLTNSPRTVNITPAYNPQGYLDKVDSPSPGKLHVRGWAFDKDNVNTALTIHIYVGGPAGSGAPAYAITANKERADVNKVFPGVGNNHGFDETINVSKSGTLQIYAYAINIGGGTTNPNLTNSPKTVTIKQAYNPQGYLDNADSPSPGKLHVRGWAFDKDDVNAALAIHIYVGGPAGSGAPCYAIKANKERTDVNKTFPGAGNYHGFDETINVSKSGNQSVYAYAINIGGGTTNPNLTNSPKTVNIKTDTEAPKISNVYQDNFTNEGYTLNFTASDNIALSSVTIYTNINGNNRKEEVIKLSGQTQKVTYKVKYSDFNTKSGYKHGIWLYDTSGNITKSAWIEVKNNNPTEPKPIETEPTEPKTIETEPTTAKPTEPQPTENEPSVIEITETESTDPGNIKELEVFTYNGFECQILENNTIEITKYIGSDSKITVPSKINGKKVTSIGHSAFSYCQSIKSVTISERIETIDHYAFKFCMNLNEIKIPNSVTRIKSFAFEGCQSLTDIKLPEKIKAIEYNTFSLCSNLENVSLPNGLETIGENAFSSEKLNSIYIPESVFDIQSSAFAYCTNLEKIIVNENNLNYISKDGILYDITMKSLIQYPTGKKDKKYIIPNGITDIKGWAICCGNLNSVVIPKSVNNIEENNINYKIYWANDRFHIETFSYRDIYYDYSNINIYGYPYTYAEKYFGDSLKLLEKKANTITVKTKKAVIKAKKLKKKAQKVKAITVKNNQGKVTYKLVKSGITKKIRKLVNINSKGIITIKKWKKAKKGTYKIKVKITAAGNSAYNAKSVTKVVKVKIK